MVGFLFFLSHSANVVASFRVCLWIGMPLLIYQHGTKQLVGPNETLRCFTLQIRCAHFARTWLVWSIVFRTAPVVTHVDLRSPQPLQLQPYFGGHFHRDYFRSEEAARDIISSPTVEKVGIDVSVKCGDSVLNCSWIIRHAHFGLDKRTNNQQTTTLK